jgi:hypothetical protein
MEQAVGEDWTDEMQEAWQSLWDTACAKMMDVIHEGEQHGPVIEAMWAKASLASFIQEFVCVYICARACVCGRDT